MIIQRNFYKFFLLLFTFSFVTSSCNKDFELPEAATFSEDQLLENAEPILLLEWYELYLEIERYLEDFRPNPTTRALAYIGIAAYESALPGMPGYISISEVFSDYELAGRNPYDRVLWINEVEGKAYWEAVLNHVYYKTLSYFMHDLSNAEQTRINKLYFNNAQKLSSEITSFGYQKALERANTIVESVIAYAQSDEESEQQVLDVEPESYIPPTGPGLWQPTAPDFRNACHPYWYKVRRFATPNNGIEFISPAAYDENPNSRFYKEAKEVNDAVENLTEEDRWIAEFWSDDITGITFSPPARQIAIANQLVKQHQFNMEQALILYMKLGIALNDASVTCWDGKYKFNLERPIDYIRRVINPEFQTILGDAEGIPSQNPNFPAYPSGHSTFGAVAASVFEYFFEIEEFTDRCHEDRIEFNGTPRTFTDFYDMAEENAYSRIPLGVHFRMDCDEGLRLGFEVGKYVNNLDLKRPL